MSTYMGRCRLSEHDPDPEEYDHRIRPGQWVKVTCAESDPSRMRTDVHVWSGLTDTAGEFGEPQMFTEWGSHDGRTPVMAEVSYFGDNPKPCEHMVYILDKP